MEEEEGRSREETLKKNADAQHCKKFPSTRARQLIITILFFFVLHLVQAFPRDIPVITICTSWATLLHFVLIVCLRFFKHSNSHTLPLLFLFVFLLLFIHTSINTQRPMGESHQAQAQQPAHLAGGTKGIAGRN